MTPPVELSPGDVFAGDYRVERPLKQGGMGAVYVVEQISTSEKRALKLMLPAVVARPGAQKRFELEAKVGAKIESAHVVKVIQAGVDEATKVPWLVMELLRGEDLETYAAQRGPLPAGEVREIFSQLCHALGEAHGHADVIVHRDLKPENVFLAKAQQRGLPFLVKVLDFGIARVVAEAKTASSKTQDGLGSLYWMAPEQADPDQAITPATDVWALGLIAFRLLTGRCFWKTAYVEGATAWAWLMEAFMSPMPSASERASERGSAELLPEGFDAWFATCVNRDATKRYQDASKAFAALDLVLTGAARPEALAPTEPVAELPPAVKASLRARVEAPPEPAETKAPASRRGALAAAGIALALGLGALVWPRGGSKPGSTPAKEIERPCPEGMVLIPEGTFTMGSMDGDDNEKPPHPVQLRAYCMDKMEVRVADFRKCVAEPRGGIACTVPRGTDADKWCNWGSDRGWHPINCVDWQQADTYCRWAGGRLPTEAEWEHAARGSDGRKYPWGNGDPDQTRVNACGAECARAHGWSAMYEGDDRWPETSPVGTYGPGASPFGVLDMAGNVWEWVADWYAPYPDTKAPVSNPTGPAEPLREHERVMRGGGWRSADPYLLRAANRGGHAATEGGTTFGFRCARAPK